MCHLTLERQPFSKFSRVSIRVTACKPKQLAERNMLSFSNICEYICHDFNAKSCSRPYSNILFSRS